MNQLKEAPSAVTDYWRQVRRYWVVVVLVTLTCAAVAVAASRSVPTTYTGRASLIVSSPNRAPEQDAVLVQGYVDYFNDGAYQAQLVEQAGLDEPVTLLARAAASSPILLVESTASSPSSAQDSAAAVAEAFQSDINREMDADREQQVEELQSLIDEATTEGTTEDAAAASALQSQIGELQRDTTNRLQELQFEAGVSVNSPSSSTNLLFGVVGGLVLGALAALALARLAAGRSRSKQTRVRSRAAGRSR